MISVTITGMELGDLRAFLAVADAGSISRAASELYITQPAVTRRLQRLEKALGVTLLDRRRRPFSVTEEGSLALNRGRRLLRLVDELRSIASDEDMPSGEVRIGVAHALTEVTLFGPIERIRRGFPKVGVRLKTGWSRELLERVQSGALDGAVLLLPEDQRVPAGLSAQELGREELFVVARKSDGESHPRRIEELHDTGWILNPEGCNARAVLRRALMSAGLALHVDVETYSYDLQLSLVARSGGLGLVPGVILNRSPFRSELRTLRIPGLSFAFTIWSVRGRASGPFDSLLDELEHALRKVLTARRGSAKGKGRARQVRSAAS
jgi:DNA-binding transcriptional LysR family regulator